MNQTSNRHLRISVALIVALLVSSAILACWNTRQLHDDASRVAHTHQVLDATSDVLRALVDAETGERGFLITGKDNFLEPYHAALNRIDRQLKQLEELTADNPEQQHRIDRLAQLSAARVALLQQGIALRRRNAAEAREFVTTNQGKVQMDAIRALVGEMEGSESALLGHRQERSDNAYRIALATSILTAGIGLVVIGGFIGLLQRNLLASRKAAAVLHEQREWLHTTLTSMGDGVITTDRHGLVTFLNPVAQHLTGWTDAEAAGVPLEKVVAIVDETTRKPIASAGQQALTDSQTATRANHRLLVGRTGAAIPIDDRAAPIRDAQGNLIGTVVIVRDMSQRRKTELALRESEERFSAVLNNAPLVIFAKDPEGRYVLVNQPFEQYAGRPASAIIGKTDADLFTPDVAERFRALDQEVLSEGRLREFEETFDYRGQRLTFLTAKFPLQRAGVRTTLVCGIATDITARKQAIDALRTSEERLRLALEAGRMGVWEWDPLTNHLWWSENLEPIHGLAPGSFGATLADFLALVHPQDRHAVRHEIEQSVRECRPHEIEFRIVRPDGSIRWIAGSGQVICDKHRQAQRIVGVATDITTRKRQEHVMRFLTDSSAALASLVDYESTLQKVARLAVPFFADWCTVDMAEPDGSIRRVAVAHVDPSKVELAHELHRRYPPDPNHPRGVPNIIRTGEPEIIPEISNALLVERIKDPELLRILRVLGFRSYMGVPLKVRDRTLGAITFSAAESGRNYGPDDLALAQDLAHRAAVAIDNARLVHDLKEADRKKNEFLATLAHELRNPLAPLRNSLAILRMPAVIPSMAEQARDMMGRQLNQLIRLVDDLLDVGRIMRGKVQLQKAPVDLSVVIRRAVETAQPVIDSQGHELVIHQAAEGLRLVGDEMRLAQVISNLLTNAAKYTEGAGRIWLITALEDGQVVIRVRDTGIGMPPEMIPHVFDMFTQIDNAVHRSQGGLGIGLTIVKSLIELHGGTVEARSEGLGKGSEFIVRLPALSARQRAESSDGTTVPGVPAATAHRLLVVDDNIDAADSLAMMLRMQGHEVRVAHDGPAALHMAAADPPDLILLDIGMPGMDGYEVCRRLRQMDETRGIFIAALTGWGQEEDRRRSREAGFDEHLVKPLDPQKFYDILKRLTKTPA